MSVLYCTIPHFAAALARRDDPDLGEEPLVLVGPEGRVFDTSAGAAACGVVAGMTARAAEVRCPGAHLLEADVARCRGEAEVLFQVLEAAGPHVEPHGWGAAYVDLGDLARNPSDAASLCGEMGRAVRGELGAALQPALGWDSTKFTAQAAARRTPPGRLRAVAHVEEREFLRPLPVALLPLDGEAVQRLCFLGLRTLGQYAALSAAAAWQQFGPAGKMAHRCARGDDDRPVVPRGLARHLAAAVDFETPLVERERLMAALGHLVAPLLTELRGNLQACGQVRLAVQFDGDLSSAVAGGGAREVERAFLLPTASERQIGGALEELLDRLVQSYLPALRRKPPTGGKSPSGRSSEACREATGVASLAVTLEQIQDTIPEQLAFFPSEKEQRGKLQEVERYLTARFGTPPQAGGYLRRAVLDRPGAPLPEWRVSWRSGGDL